VVVDEALVIRQRRQHEQRQRDMEFLEWLSRFRFCSSELLELRFATSMRKCRKRLGRLEQAGLVISHQPHLAAAKLYAIARAGSASLGLSRRRSPRWDTQTTHELAVGRLVAQLETARTDLGVLTERDCRRAEASDQETYSVICQQRAGAMRRWPDIVIEGHGRRVAVEIELSPKTTERLKAILLGYLTTRQYDEVHVRCGSQALEQRLRGLVEQLYGSQMVRVGPHD